MKYVFSLNKYFLAQKTASENSGFLL